MSKKSIHIVEDEVLIALAEQILIENLGHEVTAISRSGEAAVAAIERELPDLVLMDIRLSGEMDGREAALIIREQHDIPILFISTYRDKNHFGLDELEAHGRYGYIAKPYGQEEFSRAIQKLLDEDQQ